MHNTGLSTGRDPRRLTNDASTLGSLALAALLGAACSSGEQATTDSAAAAGDTAGASTAMFASAGATDSMKVPESVRYDAELDAFFVSNINGNPSQKDGNGFIARVDAANTSAMTMLVEGGKNGATLNAPKGMAIVGDTLWVTDIDAVRGFDKRTGAAVATIDLRSQGAVFLNDVVAGPDGDIYVTDTGIRFDASGAMSHPGTDQVFRISKRTPTVAIRGDSVLKRPNGIAWDAANDRFIVGSFSDPLVMAWKAGDSTVTQIATGPGGYDGVEVLSDGRILVSSWADSAVHAISNGGVRKVIANVEGPADIGVDTKRNVVAVPRFNGGRVEYFSISR
jgi:sugar lactone lactonase YvrE